MGSGAGDGSEKGRWSRKERGERSGGGGVTWCSGVWPAALWGRCRLLASGGSQLRWRYVRRRRDLSVAVSAVSAVMGRHGTSVGTRAERRGCNVRWRDRGARVTVEPGRARPPETDRPAARATVTHGRCRCLVFRMRPVAATGLAVLVSARTGAPFVWRAGPCRGRRGRASLRRRESPRRPRPE
jgi:hypothetical protein